MLHLPFRLSPRISGKLLNLKIQSTSNLCFYAVSPQCYSQPTFIKKILDRCISICNQILRNFLNYWGRTQRNLNNIEFNNRNCQFNNRILRIMWFCESTLRTYKTNNIGIIQPGNSRKNFKEQFSRSHSPILPRILNLKENIYNAKRISINTLLIAKYYANFIRFVCSLM